MSVATVKRLCPAVSVPPCQRSIKFLRQLAGMPDECIDDRLAILAGYLDQHDVTRLTLNEGCNLAAAPTAKQIPFPVARYGPVFNGRRAFADRYRVPNPAVIVS